MPAGEPIPPFQPRAHPRRSLVAHLRSPVFRSLPQYVARTRSTLRRPFKRIETFPNERAQRLPHRLDRDVELGCDIYARSARVYGDFSTVPSSQTIARCARSPSSIRLLLPRFPRFARNSRKRLKKERKKKVNFHSRYLHRRVCVVLMGARGWNCREKFLRGNKLRIRWDVRFG